MFFKSYKYRVICKSQFHTYSKFLTLQVNILIILRLSLPVQFIRAELVLVV